MSIIEIIIIAVVEAMDCFAVAIATGLSKKGIKYSRAMLQAVSFGVFQGGMTLIGEVSRVNDDNVDNHFYDIQGRFPDIEEDEPILYPLFSEYPEFR